MKDKAIILDLDDTLISTHYRQYCCINDYLTSEGKQFIAFEDYLQMRRSNNVSNTNLLKTLHIDLDWEAFRSYYLNNIESENYLALDELIVEKHFLAEAGQKDLKLVLLSLRSNHANSQKQIQHLGIAGFFAGIYFEKHDEDNNPKLNRLQQLNSNFDIVACCGDSVSDYEAALQLNINFVQVKTSLYLLPDFEQARQFDNINQYFSAIL
jgi:phosphoglycolate phosphatase-like HAD superfamily hydrolase